MKSLGKDKLLKIGIGIIAGVILITIILLVVHACSNKKNGYGDIENKMLKAAQKYYKGNENLLPKTSGEEVSIDDVTLTSLGYLSNMADLVKDKEGVTCSGKVVITYNNNRYRYTPLLDCGDAYKSQTLASYIESHVNRVFTGNGLYDLNGEYVYRGEEVNNYVKFADHNYRIVKISNGHVVLILNEKVLRAPWDDRYNKTRNRTEGINNYYNVDNGEKSRVAISLDEIYNGDDYFDDDDKTLLATHDLQVGKRSETANYNDGSIEKSEIYANQYIGLLPLYDYINASLDLHCNSAKDFGCSNYNYLSHYRFNWWLQTADSQTTYKVYRITSNGIIDNLKASSYGYIRPVIYLVKDALYVTGDGTEDNPYTIK